MRTERTVPGPAGCCGGPERGRCKCFCSEWTPEPNSRRRCDGGSDVTTYGRPGSGGCKSFHHLTQRQWKGARGVPGPAYWDEDRGQPNIGRRTTNSAATDCHAQNPKVREKHGSAEGNRTSSSSGIWTGPLQNADTEGMSALLIGARMVERAQTIVSSQTDAMACHLV
ncbi:hypothetical protein BDW74DRAFT_124624 [Aspergillus multicolor]|uniref:uncharacterized protein n=1 Tax=Aspergillus multicolor TaxID=41759 RepID=UPI003CCD58F2